MACIWTAMCIPQWNTRKALYVTVIALYFMHFTFFHWRYTGGVVYSVLENPKKHVKLWFCIKMWGLEFFPWQVYGRQNWRV